MKCEGTVTVVGVVYAALSLAAFVLFVPQPANAARFTHPTLGYSLAYPDTWHAGFIPPPGGLTLTSFPEYQHGGVIPPGGVDIHVLLLSPDQTNDTAINDLTRYDRVAARKTVLMHGVPAERLDWAEQLSSEHNENWVAIAVRIGGKQFLCFLSYWANDPKAARWEQVFDDVIASVLVTDVVPETPAPSH